MTPRRRRPTELEGDLMTGPSPDPGVAQTLAEAFETFEAIRQLARRHEGRSPDLFAAFMAAGVAAANGRDAVLTADALRAHRPPPAGPAEPASGADPHQVADSAAASAAVLANHLDHAAAWAQTRQDCRACRNAAYAARQIHELLARADDAHAG